MEIMNKEETANSYYRPKRICPVCGTEYQPKNIRRVFCSSLCRWRAFSMKKAGGILGESNKYLLSGTEQGDKQPVLSGCSNGEPTQNNGNPTENSNTANANPTETNAKLTESDVSIILPTETNANPTENSNTANANPTQVNEKLTQTNPNPTEIPVAFVPMLEEEHSFTDAIAEKVNERGLDEKFISPFEHWPSEQAEAIRKANQYLRCLLNSTLNLLRHRKIPATALRDLANGYAYVLNSETFIRSGHPYDEVISELHRKLSYYYKQFKNNAKLRLVLKREDKIEIISMLHEIGNSVPLQKFSELFSAVHT